MKNLAQRFLTESEYKRVDEAVRAAEKRTAGEIVCLIKSASYHYPLASVIGAAFFALPLSLALTALIGSRFWIGPQNMWLFLGVFVALFAVGHGWIDRTPGVKRRFIARKDIEEEVEEAAVSAFFRQGLYRTREATGVLLFISVFERKVWILADHGINAKVQPGQWDEIVARLTAGIARNASAAAVCEAVEAIGKIVQTHFPIPPDDRNELKNVIIDNGR